MFDAEKVKSELIEWIRNWFNENGPESKAIIGISGGKDSTIVTKLCIEALGKNRVIGIRMPQGNQHDLDMAKEVCDYFDIQSHEVNIENHVNNLFNHIRQEVNDINYICRSNTPARVRMTILYMFAACLNGRVANTCNYSEDYVGYATKYGDAAGDFSPLMDLTVTEVKLIGHALGLPIKFINKTPEDGLSGKTDEDNLGFTYERLDKYIRHETVEGDNEFTQKVDRMHKANLHKLNPMPHYRQSGCILRWNDK